MSAERALEDLLPVESPAGFAMSFATLAEIHVHLPARVSHLVRALLGVFAEEVQRPVTQASGKDEALARFESRLDVVGTVRVCIQRSLFESRCRSEALRLALSGSAARLSKRLRQPAQVLLGRPHAIMLTSSMARASEVAVTWFQLVDGLLGEAAHPALVGGLTSPAYVDLATVARSVEGLQLLCALALEEDKPSRMNARVVLSGIVEELWRLSVIHEERALSWMLDLIHAAKTNKEVHEALHELASPHRRFERFAAEWRDATGHMSNPSHILRYPAYHEILAMRWDAVPSILGALKDDQPWFWGPALVHITGEDPPYEGEERETVEGVARAWLRLAGQRGWQIGGKGWR